MDSVSPRQIFLMFDKNVPDGSDSKESACNMGNLGLIPGWRRSPGEGNDHSLQYSCLENSMDRGAWQATVHGVAESDMTERLTLGVSQVALVKNLPANAGHVRDVGLIPGLGRSPGEGYRNPLKYSCLENSMDRGAWQGTVHGVTKSQTRLINKHFHTILKC